MRKKTMTGKVSILLETIDSCSCSKCQVLLSSRECIRCQKQPDLENKMDDKNTYRKDRRP